MFVFFLEIQVDFSSWPPSAVTGVVFGFFKGCLQELIQHRPVRSPEACGNMHAVSANQCAADALSDPTRTMSILSFSL